MAKNITIDVKDCDLTNGFYHFTSITNAESILDNGLQPSIGPASRMVGDRENVSVSQGGKGIMGIISSFIYECKEMRISEIPEEFKRYFSDDIVDFTSDDVVGLDLACRAMVRKLKGEVYFNVELDDSMLEKAEIGGLTGYDIKLPMGVDKSKVRLVTDSGKVISAYGFVKSIYERAKDVDIFREMHEDFFYMFESEQSYEHETSGRQV